MSVSLTVNGSAFDFPETGESDWGSDVTAWATAVSQSTLQKAGGAYTLAAEVDFGANFGLKSLYYKGRTANPAASGIVRLARADEIKWRDQANSADLALGVNASDQLTWQGVALESSANNTFSDSSQIDFTIGASVSASIVAASIDTADLADLAVETGKIADDAVTADKIADDAVGSDQIADDAVGADQIAGSSITAHHLAANSVRSSEIDNGAVSDTHVNASAAITLSKLAALTASRALVSDGSGVITVSDITAGQLAGLEPLATYTPSAEGSVDITGVMDSTYDKYEIHFRLVPATDNVFAFMRTDDADGDSFDSSGYLGGMRVETQSGAADNFVNSTSTILIAGGDSAVGTTGIGNGAGEGCWGIVQIDTVNKTVTCVAGYVLSTVTSSVSSAPNVSNGIQTGGSTINAVRLAFSSGNVASGDVRIYGVPN